MSTNVVNTIIMILHEYSRSRNNQICNKLPITIITGCARIYLSNQEAVYIDLHPLLVSDYPQINTVALITNPFAANKQDICCLRLAYTE